MTKMSLEVQGDTQIIVRRRFAASPDAVYRAHLEPDLIRQWMSGPDEWVITTCESDARPGGKLHFVWEGPGGGFSIKGEYHELDPGKRILHTERMYLPDPTPDNNVETLFKADGGGTLLVMTMTLPDAATRKAMLDTGMADGMEVSYDKLDDMLQS